MYLCEILFIGQYRHQEKDNSIIASNERESRNLSRLSRSKVPADDREACKQKAKRAVETNCVSKFTNWCKVSMPLLNICDCILLCINLVTHSQLTREIS
jgi:hypothetical protein